MRWLCILLPDLSMEALAPPTDMPFAVYEQQGSRKFLSQVNAPARQHGLRVGMGLPGALGLVPALRTARRKPDLEAALVQDVACWAYQFGTPVVTNAAGHAVWVEVASSIALFGGWPALLRRLHTAQDAPPYHRQWGVAPTLACAYLQARINAGLHKGILRIEDIATRIGPLPLMLLPLPPESLELLQGAGLSRIADVMAMPREALGRRLGPAGLKALDQLYGRAPEAFVSFAPPDCFRRRFDFGEPVETAQALLFPLKMMLGELCRYLYTRDVMVQHFALHLRDSRKRRSTHEIGLLSPSRDPERLLRIVREKVERIQIQDGLIEITLDAQQFSAAHAVQDDLFGNTSTVGQQLTELKERLAARLGTAALREIAVSADQRPERSSATSQSTVVPGTHHPPRPLWLLPAPRRIQPKRLLSPPERIELGWLDGDHDPRDYFVAQDQNDRVCWVFRTADGAYYLHGYWQ